MAVRELPVKLVLLPQRLKALARAREIAAIDDDLKAVMHAFTLKVKELKPKFLSMTRRGSSIGTAGASVEAIFLVDYCFMARSQVLLEKAGLTVTKSKDMTVVYGEYKQPNNSISVIHLTDQGVMVLSAWGMMAGHEWRQ